jgi:hypothetical protein
MASSINTSNSLKAAGFTILRKADENICFSIEEKEILKIDKNGVYYLGRKIEDDKDVCSAIKATMLHIIGHGSMTPKMENAIQLITNSVFKDKFMIATDEALKSSPNK